MNELTSQYDAQDLLEHLIGQPEEVVYRINGNRAFQPAIVLQRLEAVMPKIGITRVAEISQLAFNDFPVFQSSRPSLFFHSVTGQNSGAQGKGTLIEQAKISCLMETIENYCSEPRNAGLIRSSFNHLRSQYAIANPKSFILCKETPPPKFTEPLMWTEALWIEGKQKVLVPAETVFFPFFAQDYQTQPYFPVTGNGVAAGSTYLEAAIHAIYEVIERHYRALWEMGRPIKVEAFFEDEIEYIDIQQLKQNLGAELQLQLFAYEIPGLKNLPFIICNLVDDFEYAYRGCGCSGNVGMSFNRGISEALQSMATVFSGTREDIESDMKRHSSGDKKKSTLPLQRSLHLKDYKKRVIDREFSSLREEFDFLLQWIHRAGFPNVFIANLTRHGVDIPVVRATIPGMYPPLEYRVRCHWTSQETRQASYIF